MKTILIIMGLVLAGGAVCFVIVRPASRPVEYAFVIDESKSVPDDARAEAHTSVEQNVDYLHRGDSLVVIPLTGDAATQTPGKVQRFRLSAERKAYDVDLKQARSKVREMLDKSREESLAHPYMRTDVLGTLRLAEEEKGTSESFVLAILSDMIQDTTTMNFMTHPALARTESARKLADQLMAGHEKVWAGAHIFLGQLRSEDLGRTQPERREAIRAFWLEYFRAGGATDVVFATDGVGQLEGFMRRVKPVS